MNKRYTIVVFILGVISCLGMFFLDQGFCIYGFLQSFFAGFVFWFMVVFFPEYRHKKAVYRFMVNRYKEFRINLIRIFLKAAEVFEYNKEEELLDHENFKKFFGTKRDFRSADLLCVAESEMDCNPAYLNDIRVAFKHFSDEIDFAITKLVSDDVQLFEELNFLKRRMYNLFNLSCYKGDPSKYIGQFFWDTLGWWSEMHGDRPNDWIADSIEKLKR